MKIGMFLPTFRDWADVPSLRELVAVCDSNGLDSVWIPDRVAFPIGEGEGSQVRDLSTWMKESTRKTDYWGEHGGGYRSDQKVGECFRDVYVAAGLIAGMSDRLYIGTSIALVPQRNPVTTARAIATLDELSHGRFIWGVGMGHVPGEYAALNLAYDERQAMFEEWLDCIIALWTQDPVDFHGTYWNFDDLRMLLPMFSRPHPPILIGGNGKRALRLSARLGAGWIPANLRPEELAVGLQYLKGQWKEHGHDDRPTIVAIARFRMSAVSMKPDPNSRPIYTPDELASVLAEFEAVGCDTVVAHVPTRDLKTMCQQVVLLTKATKLISS